MEVRVLVQRETEPVDEGHRPGTCLGTGTQAAAQVMLDRIQKNAQGTVEGFAVVLEVIAQPLGYGQHLPWRTGTRGRT